MPDDDRRALIDFGRDAWTAVHEFTAYARDFPDLDYFADVGALLIRLTNERAQVERK